MGLHRFVLVSRWRLQADAGAVWQLLTDVEAWPSWWRYVRAARRIERAPTSPLGDVVELDWGSALPYGLRLAVTTEVAERPHRLQGRARGDLRGSGTWVLEPVPAAGPQHASAVDVTYRWEVELERPWMRALSFLLRPLFEWNHFVVMRAGAQGMAQRLGSPLSQLHEWSGYARA